MPSSCLLSLRLRSPEEIRLAMDLYNQQLMSQLHRQQLSAAGLPTEADQDRGRAAVFTPVRPGDNTSNGEIGHRPQVPNFSCDG